MKTETRTGILRCILMLAFAAGLIGCNLVLAQEQVAPTILFTSDYDGRGDVYTMSLDGSNVQRFTEATSQIEGDIFQADLSPDGKWLLLSVRNDWRFENDYAGEIFLLNLETDAVTQITNDRQNSQRPVWAFDSSKFAYLTQEGLLTYAQIMQVEVPSLEQSILRLNTPYLSEDPQITKQYVAMDWSPDMQHVVVKTYELPPGAFPLFFVNLDSTQVIGPELTHSLDSSPRWSSDPDIVYFVCDDDMRICIFDLNSLATFPLVDLSAFSSRYRINDLDVARDGRVIFPVTDFENDRKDVYIYNTSDGELTNLTDDSEFSWYRWIYDADLPPMNYDNYMTTLCSPMSLPPRLAIGDRAYVIDLQTGGNIIRSGVGFAHERVALASVNSNMTILDGPVCVDEIVWYQVQLDDGVVGWTAEGEGDTYYLGHLPE